MTTKEKILKHKAVWEYYQDSDGHWVILNDGYINYDGCCGMREDTITRLYRALSMVKFKKGKAKK